MARDIGGALCATLQSSLPTYRVNLHDFAPATGALDFLTISVPAASTAAMMVTRVYAAMDATASSTLDIYLTRRTAANTGGTAVTLTTATQSVGGGTAVIVQSDSRDAATVTTVLAYTANPSSYGTGVQIEAGHITVPATATPGIPIEPWEIQFANRGSKPPIVRPGELLGASFGGQATPAGAALYLTIEWVEVPLAMLY